MVGVDVIYYPINGGSKVIERYSYSFCYLGQYSCGERYFSKNDSREEIEKGIFQVVVARLGMRGVENFSLGPIRRVNVPA